MQRIAKATRISGNLYNVEYPGENSYDRGVRYSYLVGLARKGFRVEVDQKTCRGEGEPAQYTVVLDE